MNRLVYASVAATTLVVSPFLAQAQTAAVPGSPPAPLTIGETFTLESKVLNEVRRINVYLPPPYSQSPDMRPPVLYMPDGGMAEDFLHVAGLVQVLVGNGSMRPFVLVGIENTQRRRDLTGPTSNDEDKKIAPQVGGSAAFRTFIRSELMPAVNARYRTASETAIMGESLAGLFVVETLFLEPDMFDTYIAFDPSVWWNDGGLLKGRVPPSDRKKVLYLAASVDDRDGLTRQLTGVLRKNAPPNLTWHYERMSGETHATIYHPAAIIALRWLFKPGEEAAKGTVRTPPRRMDTKAVAWIFLGFGALILLLGLVGISGRIPDLDEGWSTIAFGTAYLLQRIAYLRRDLEWFMWAAIGFMSIAVMVQFRSYRRRRAARRACYANGNSGALPVSDRLKHRSEVP
jgi:predicted alpha/beta superfamily hydrolase